MAYGPNSNNPRERRAYAHTRIAELKQGKVKPEVAIQAVLSAANTIKGQKSGFFESLGKAATVVVALNQVTEPLVWVSYTIPAQGATRRDGYIVNDEGTYGLDIATLSDTCCVSTEERILATQTWEEEGVYMSADIERHGANTLVIPSNRLTVVNVDEALRRHAA